jgi:uncharacterized protein HemX
MLVCGASSICRQTVLCGERSKDVGAYQPNGTRAARGVSGEGGGGRLWGMDHHRPRRGRMKRKLAALSAVALMFGAAACGGVQDQLERRAQEEVDKGRQRIEKEVEKGRKQVEEQVGEQRTQIEKEVEKGRQQVEERVKEEQQKVGGEQ